MIQTFVSSIVCLFTSYKKYYHHPYRMEPSKLPHVKHRYPIHTCLLSADHPRISRQPKNSQTQLHYVRPTMYSHTGQNDYTLSRKQLSVLLGNYNTDTAQVFWCLQVISISIIAYDGENQTDKTHAVNSLLTRTSKGIKNIVRVIGGKL